MMEITLSNGARHLTNQPILFGGGHMRFTPFINDTKDILVDCEQVEGVREISEGGDTLELTGDSYGNTINNLINPNGDKYNY